MKNRHLLTFALLIVGNIALAKPAVFEKGDGDLDLVCEQADQAARPYHVFELTLFYDKNSPRTIFDVLSDKNLGKRNNDVVYEMKVKQYPFAAAEVVVPLEDVDGCERSPITFNVDANKNLVVDFECRADGDAGFGTIQFEKNPLKASGSIHFPEGNKALGIPEDSDIQVSCRIKI